MAIYLERIKPEPFSEEELREAIECVESSGRFHRDPIYSEPCYFLGENTSSYALQIHRSRVHVNEQLVPVDDPVIQFLIDVLKPTHFIRHEEVVKVYPISELRR